MDGKEKTKRTNLHGADGRNDGRIHQRTHNKLMEKKNVRTYTYAQLDCKYDALCLKDKIQLEDLEYMQQYNGGTIKTCIFGYGL
jgi:hypothetical protein